MNVHTFKDVGKRDSLAHDVDDADDDAPVARMKGNVDGEEEGDTKFNDIGEVMEPFNLKEERENGYYDDGGNYVSRDEHKEVDAWVADLDEATMEKAIGESARAQQKKRQREAAEHVAELKKQDRPLCELKTAILALMEPGENVKQAMKRMSQNSSKLRQNNWKKQNPVARISGTGSKKVKTASPLEDFIELVDACISQHGQFNVYSMTYEVLRTSLSQWEYKAPGSSGGTNDPAQVFGPFTSQQIAQWKSQNYLTGATAVFMRRYVAPSVTKKATMSMFDDDEDISTDTNAGSSATATAGDTQDTEDNPWTHSDSIDFGAYEPEEKPAGPTATAPAVGQLESDSEDERDSADEKPSEDVDSDA